MPSRQDRRNVSVAHGSGRSRGSCALQSPEAARAIGSAFQRGFEFACRFVGAAASEQHRAEELVRGLDHGRRAEVETHAVLALDGGIARDVYRASAKVDSPGSELTARFRRPDHPIAYGYPEITSVFRENRPVYRVRRPDEGKIVLQWGAKIPKDDEEPADKKKTKTEEEPALVVSGGVKGGDDLVGKPAILDAPVGKGRVVAFDFDPIHRYMTRSDFRLVWNALLNWNDLPPTPVREGAPPAR